MKRNPDLPIWWTDKKLLNQAKQLASWFKVEGKYRHAMMIEELSKRLKSAQKENIANNQGKTENPQKS